MIVRGAVFILSCLTVLSPGIAKAEVSVADRLRYSLLSESRELHAKNYIAYPYSLAQGDKLEIRVGIKNRNFSDLNVFICPTEQVNLFIQRRYSSCYGVQKGLKQVAFEYEIPKSGQYSIVLDNSYAKLIAKKYDVEVFKTGSVPMDVRAQVTTFLTQFSSGIRKGFKVPQIDFKVAPCGAENAFSANADGAITVCSELFIRLSREQRHGAMFGILFHELGHSLLNLWGLPGWDNEQAVDEFAVYMLYQMGRQELAFDLANYFAEFDSSAESNRILYQDRRHPISIQRARNIIRVLKMPQEVMKRWNNLIYPRLTDFGLRGVINNPGLYGDRVLAGSILSERANQN